MIKLRLQANITTECPGDSDGGKREEDASHGPGKGVPGGRGHRAFYWWESAGHKGDSEGVQAGRKPPRG